MVLHIRLEVILGRLNDLAIVNAVVLHTPVFAHRGFGSTNDDAAICA